MPRINLAPIESLALNGILAVINAKQAEVDRIKQIYFSKFIDGLENKDITSFTVVENDNDGYPTVIEVPPSMAQLQEAIKNGPLRSEPG